MTLIGKLSRAGLGLAGAAVVVAGLLAAAGNRTASDQLVLAAAGLAVVAVALGLVSLPSKTDDDPTHNHRGADRSLEPIAGEQRP